MFVEASNNESFKEAQKSSHEKYNKVIEQYHKPFPSHFNQVPTIPNQDVNTVQCRFCSRENAVGSETCRYCHRFLFDRQAYLNSFLDERYELDDDDEDDEDEDDDEEDDYQQRNERYIGVGTDLNDDSDQELSFSDSASYEATSRNSTTSINHWNSWVDRLDFPAISTDDSSASELDDSRISVSDSSNPTRDSNAPNSNSDSRNSENPTMRFGAPANNTNFNTVLRVPPTHSERILGPPTNNTSLQPATSRLDLTRDRSVSHRPQAPRQQHSSLANVNFEEEEESSNETEVSNTRTAANQPRPSLSAAPINTNSLLTSHINAPVNVHYAGPEPRYPQRQHVPRGPAYMATLAASYSSASARARAGTQRRHLQYPLQEANTESYSGPPPMYLPSQDYVQHRDLVGSTTNLLHPISLFRPNGSGHLGIQPNRPPNNSSEAAIEPINNHNENRPAVPATSRPLYLPYPFARSQEYPLPRPGEEFASSPNDNTRQRHHQQAQNPPYSHMPIPHAVDQPSDRSQHPNVRSSIDLGDINRPSNIPNHTYSRSELNGLPYPSHQNMPGWSESTSSLRMYNSNPNLAARQESLGHSTHNLSRPAVNPTAPAQPIDQRNRRARNNSYSNNDSRTQSNESANTADTSTESLLGRAVSNIALSDDSDSEANTPPPPVQVHHRQTSGHRHRINSRSSRTDKRRETSSSTFANRTGSGHEVSSSAVPSASTTASAPSTQSPSLDFDEDGLQNASYEIRYDSAGYLMLSQSDLATARGRRIQRVIDYRRRHEGAYDPDVEASGSADRDNKSSSDESSNDHDEIQPSFYPYNHANGSTLNTRRSTTSTSTITTSIQVADPNSYYTHMHHPREYQNRQGRRHGGLLRSRSRDDHSYLENGSDTNSDHRSDDEEPRPRGGVRKFFRNMR